MRICFPFWGASPRPVGLGGCVSGSDCRSIGSLEHLLSRQHQLVSAEQTNLDHPGPGSVRIKFLLRRYACEARRGVSAGTVNAVVASITQIHWLWPDL